MLTVECRNNHIVAIQCLQAEFGEIVTKALSYGRKDLNCIIEKNALITAFLNQLCQYSPFTTDLHKAFKLTFDGSDVNYSFDGTIDNIAKVPIPFSIPITVGSGESQAQEFYDLIHEEQVFIELLNDDVNIVIDGNCVFVWYYEVQNFSITHIPYITVDEVTDSPCAILDLMNCLSRDQLCSILTKAYGLFGLNANVTADNGEGALFTLPGAVGGAPPTIVGVQVYNVTSLPPSVPVGTTSLFINITSQTSNVEIFGYAPPGLANGAHVRIRKQNTDPYKILFTDGVNDYDFVNQEGEYMDFIWDDINSKLIV